MAVKNSMLYVDSFIDLLVIDISTINDPQLVKRMEDVFTYSLPLINEMYPVANIHMDTGVVVDWKIEKTKEVSRFMVRFNVSDCTECQQTDVETKSAVSVRINLAQSISQFIIIFIP